MIEAFLLCTYLIFGGLLLSTLCDDEDDSLL